MPFAEFVVAFVKVKSMSKQTLIFGLLIVSLIFPLEAFSQTQQPTIKVPRRNVKETFVKCQGCHKADGSGGTGYGGFAANLRDTKLDHNGLVDVITNGRQNRGMPPFKGVLSESDIDALATYIETEFKGKKK